MNEHQLVVDGLRLNYLEQGKGTPLLLLHGTAIDSARLSFAHCIPYFARHFRVIAPDWPGYGKSEYPRTVLGIKEYTRLIGALIQTLQIEHHHLLGFSMGGAVALNYALSHAKVDSLTLVSSYGLGKRLHIPLLPYIALRIPRLSASVLLGLRHSKTLTRLVLKYLIFARPGALTPKLVDEVHQQLSKPYVEEAFMHFIRGEIGIRSLRTYQNNLETLRVPTLLLHGSRDLVIPISNSKQAAKKIPGARFSPIPDCGHWVMREQPQLFEEQTLKFLLEHR